MKKPKLQILYNAVQHLGKNNERVYLAQKWMNLDDQRGTFPAICRDIIAKGFVVGDGNTFVPGHMIVGIRRIQDGKTTVMGAEGIVITVDLTQLGRETAGRIAKYMETKDASETDL